MLVIRRRGNGEFIFEERRPPQQNLLTLVIIALIFLSFQVTHFTKSCLKTDLKN